MDHRDATRTLDQPNQVIPVTTDTCPKCKHPLGSHVRNEKRIVFDIPPPQKIVVTEHAVDGYRCNNCGSEVEARHRDLPQEGDMGIYLLNYITMLK